MEGQERRRRPLDPGRPGWDGGRKEVLQVTQTPSTRGPEKLRLVLGPGGVLSCRDLFI